MNSKLRKGAIQRHWWKALGVLLVIYALTAGLLAPLKPGIITASPQLLQAGSEVVLQVKGYNSFYLQSADKIRGWLKLDNTHALAAKSITAISDTRLQLSFEIPAVLPIQSKTTAMSLILDNPTDGPSVLPSAVSITQERVDSLAGAAVWPQSNIEKLNPSPAGIRFPFRNILYETIRNTYFHVALWFAMILLFLPSVWHSAQYLRRFNPEDDHRASAYTRVGVLFGVLGLITGAIWAKHTWNAYWSWDVKQNMTAIALFIYIAYFILRAAFTDSERKARLAAVYNLFAFSALIPLIFVIPRLTDSLHPGAGGNPALGGEDLDNTMRMVFYPAIIGWTLLGVWMAQLNYRIDKLMEE
jgi:heme exporter protein C